MLRKRNDQPWIGWVWLKEGMAGTLGGPAVLGKFKMPVGSQWLEIFPWEKIHTNVVWSQKKHTAGRTFLFVTIVYHIFCNIWVASCYMNDSSSWINDWGLKIIFLPIKMLMPHYFNHIICQMWELCILLNTGSGLILLHALQLLVYIWLFKMLFWSPRVDMNANLNETT